MGGTIEACCLQPIDVIKTRLQLDKAGKYKGQPQQAISRPAAGQQLSGKQQQLDDVPRQRSSAAAGQQRRQQLLSHIVTADICRSSVSLSVCVLPQASMTVGARL